MSIRLMKMLDRGIGRIAALLLPKPVPSSCGEPQSILLIRPGGIGDAVHLIPSIQLLRELFPSVHIDILAETRNAAVFSLCPDVRHIFRYDSPVELLKAIRTSYDVVIDTEQWHRLSAVVARMSDAPVKIGFATNCERARMFNHGASYSHETREADSFMALLQPLSVPVRSVPERWLTVPSSAVDAADHIMEPIGCVPFVTVFPGASIPERRWNVSKFKAVADLLLKFGITSVVLGGSGDRAAGEMICREGGLNLTGRTSLAESAAVIARSSLLISGDSGMLHIAVGLNVPTVSLFGPGRANKWAPRGDRHIVINKQLECSPCTTFGTTPPCPRNAECIASISVDEVFNAACMLLTHTGALQSRCCKREWVEVPGSVTPR